MEKYERKEIELIEFTGRKKVQPGYTERSRQRETAEVRTGEREREAEKVRESREMREYREMRRRREAARRRRRKRRIQRRIARAVILILVFLLLGGCVWGIWKVGTYIWGRMEAGQEVFSWEEIEQIRGNHSEKPEIKEDFLTPNEYSRPQEPLEKVNNLFVHYTANAGTSAAQNRSYFENLGLTGETSASAHFVIGYDGEIIQCLPLDEIGYAVKEHNYDSISIECCYLEESGRFTQETYDSLIKLVGWLMKEYRLSADDVLRHYDAGGKLCPKYYVDEERWEKFRNDLTEYVEGENFSEVSTS